MTREPKIPMSPEQLPQQRIHEVIDLPERPAKFEFNVDYGCSPQDVQSISGSKNACYLCQTEWAWSPMHNRLDAYYLHKGKTQWSLWLKYWDDNWGAWQDTRIGTVHRRGVDQKQAAIYLLLEFWAFDAKEGDLDQYHWINEEGYLSVAELEAIARVVWP